MTWDYLDLPSGIGSVIKQSCMHHEPDGVLGVCLMARMDFGEYSEDTYRKLCATSLHIAFTPRPRTLHGIA